MVVIFSDLDGTLLDLESYSWHEAREGLSLVVGRRVPLVLCTSKTRSEVEEFRAAFQNQDPFIVENGGAVYIPAQGRKRPVPEAVPVESYWRIGLGTPYDVLRSALREIRLQTGLPLRGFSDLEDHQVAELAGLCLDRARRAKQREYDEPFLLDRDEAAEIVAVRARDLGLEVSRGGRFWHLHGGTDKGRAVERLISLYRRERGPVITVGFGDSANDLPMLEAVDVPILVQKPDGSYDHGIAMDRLVRAPAPGPRGWTWAVKRLLGRPDSRLS